MAGESYATAPATYGDIGNATAGYYSRRLLSHALPVVILDRFGMTKVLPKNMTKIMEWRRSMPIAPATTPLVEGVTPDGGDFGYVTVRVQMQQYGDFQTITDVVQDTSKDAVLNDMAQRQGEQIGHTLELLTWDVLRAGTAVTYGGNFTARGLLDQTAFINGRIMRRVNAALDRTKAAKFTGVLSGSPDYATYPIEPARVCVGHTDLKSSVRDLKGNNDSNPHNHFTTVEKYGKRAVISPHEVGSFEDHRYVLSPDLPDFEGAGATLSGSNLQDFYHTSNRADVYPLIALGREAYGCVALRGEDAVRPMVLNPGRPRGGDPLGQRGTIGWKTYWACKVFNESWMRRVELVAKQ